jgi:hypothetical protein
VGNSGSVQGPAESTKSASPASGCRRQIPPFRKPRTQPGQAIGSRRTKTEVAFRNVLRVAAGDCLQGIVQAVPLFCDLENSRVVIGHLIYDVGASPALWAIRDAAS